MDRLEAIGWTPAWASAFEELDASGTLVPARVVEEQRGALRCTWAAGDVVADVSGRLQYLAGGAEELPGVGDCVSLSLRPEERRGTVQHVLPRRTALVRKAPERPAEAQLLAANVDTVFVTTSLNRDFRARRIERTLALAREGGAEGVVVLTKLDLAEDPDALLGEARAAAGDHPVLALSALTGEGMDALLAFVGTGRTVALLGASGVGKSTLVNRLLGEELLATREIRADDHRGRHTTTHRQLVALPGRGTLIDTPGLREVGLWGDEEGVDSAFPEVEALLGECRFHDCGHTGEPGCAIAAALEDDRLSPERWTHYLRLKREAVKTAARRSARGRHQHRQRQKAFARRIRELPDKRRPR